MNAHRDYTGQQLERAEPNSPLPRPELQPGPAHGACRYPVTLGWAQQARGSWERVMVAVGWTDSARHWLYGVAIALVSVAVVLGLAAGASCRTAGAQEQRVSRTEHDVDGLRTLISDQAQRIREVDERQSERYERLLEIVTRIDARQAAEEARRAQQAQQPSQRR